MKRLLIILLAWLLLLKAGMKRLPILLAWTLLLIGLSINWPHRPKPQLVPYNEYHSAAMRPSEAPPENPPAAHAVNPKTASLDADDDVMQIGVSIILLGACLFAGFEGFCPLSAKNIFRTGGKTCVDARYDRLLMRWTLADGETASPDR